MVSKILRKSPTKSIANKRRHPHHRRSSTKKAATAASTAIISSLYTCQRRLIKLFNKLARVGTPNRHKGFKVLKKRPQTKHESSIAAAPACRTLFPEGLLPPLLSLERKTVFLDLDETLVHSQAGPPPEKYDFIVRPRIDGMVLDFYVLKRPGVDELLEKLGEKFEVVVFTAGLREYASLVVDRLDQKRVISHRLYRDSCKEVDGKFVKDLSGSGRDLRRVVIVDDNPNSYSLQPGNGVPVRPFVDDMADRELGKLIEFFEGSRCDCFEDMRDAVKEYVAADCLTYNGDESDCPNSKPC